MNGKVTQFKLESHNGASENFYHIMDSNGFAIEFKTCRRNSRISQFDIARPDLHIMTVLASSLGDKTDLLHYADLNREIQGDMEAS